MNLAIAFKAKYGQESPCRDEREKEREMLMKDAGSPGQICNINCLLHSSWLLSGQRSCFNQLRVSLLFARVSPSSLLPPSLPPSLSPSPPSVSTCWIEIDSRITWLDSSVAFFDPEERWHSPSPSPSLSLSLFLLHFIKRFFLHFFSCRVFIGGVDWLIDWLIRLLVSNFKEGRGVGECLG